MTKTIKTLAVITVHNPALTDYSICILEILRMLLYNSL